MNVWIEVYDPTYTTKLTQLLPMDASFTRKLDEAGMGQSTFAIEPRTLRELQPRRVLEIWLSELKLQWDGVSALEEVLVKRKLGTFVIDTITPSDSGRFISVKGAGIMSRLIDKITLPGLKFENVSITSALTTLTDLAGWSLNAEAALGSQYISMPFAGSNILRATQAIAESQGVHIRTGTASNTIDAGAFGTNPDSLLVEYIEGDSGEIAFRSDASLIIDRAELITDSADVVNWVVVYGGGDGDAALTMEGSTRSWVDSVTANGRTHYIIKDNFSIGQYGQIERRLNMKKINPTDSTDSAMQYARDALADAGKQWLDRHSLPYEKLRLAVRNVNDTIYPGNKIRLKYQGYLNKLGVPVAWRDINEDYFIMAVTETISSSGLAVSLEVSNLDRYQTDAAGIVVGMMDAIEVQGINIQPYPVAYSTNTGREPVDTITAVETQFHILDEALRIDSIKMIIVRDYWTAVSGVAEGGGVHRHRMFRWDSWGSGTWSGNAAWYYVNAGDPFFGSLKVSTPYLGATADLWTDGESDSHTHNVNFDNVQKDNQLPLKLGIQINGTSVASNIFPTGTPASELTAEIDITDAVKNKAGGFRGFHDVIISCDEGRGDLVAVFVIKVDIGRVR